MSSTEVLSLRVRKIDAWEELTIPKSTEDARSMLRIKVIVSVFQADISVRLFLIVLRVVEPTSLRFL